VNREAQQGQNAEGNWLHVYSDGAARGNPGPAGIGGRVIEEPGRVLIVVSEYLGEATNNVAEYQALIRVLEKAAGLEYERVRVHTDSELLANQVTGGFRVKSEALKPLLARIKVLLAGFRQVEVEYIPREKNIACDALANRAIDDGLAGLKKPILESGEGTLF
jgi:ribonuclease HI